MIALSDLMNDAPDDQVVAICQGEKILFSQFRNDVCATLNNLPHSPHLIVFEESSYRFLVAFMAALHSGATVILPPNGLPATLMQLDGQRVDVVVGKEGNIPCARLDAKAVVLDFYTSGSTGEAKCIRKHLFQIENEIHVLEETWGEVLGQAKVLATVSHQHIYGMLFKVLWSVCAGRPFVDEMFEYWEQLCPLIDGNCFIVSSPAHLSRFPDIKPACLPQMVFSSGGPLSYDAAQESAAVLGLFPTEVFGSTETGGIAYRQQNAQAVSWRPFQAVEIQCSVDRVLSIKSSYLVDDEFYETSDRIELVEGGCFHLRGRVDRIVKVEGKRVSLPEVEAALTKSSLVVEACCLITPDERQSLSAVVVLSEEGQRQQSDIGNFRMGRLLRNELADLLDQAALPRRWRFVDKIPQNTQGKRLIADLLALY